MKKIVYLDMDNVLVDFEAAVETLDADARAGFEGRLDEVPGIFARMPPMPGALDAYEELVARFEVYVLSTAPWENPSAWSDKLLWVKRHLGAPAHKRLILSHNKHLCAGDYLVDDRLKNGADRFTGEHIHFGTAAFPDWESVRAYLAPRA
ncbi:MAG: hypothetical protein AAFR16_12810 [Pseudomonadota bacterium]